MNTPIAQSLDGCLKSLMTLVIALVGLAVILGGPGILGKLVRGTTKLLAPFGAVLLRGLVILVILIAIYMRVSLATSVSHQVSGTIEAPTKLSYPRPDYASKH